MPLSPALPPPCWVTLSSLLAPELLACEDATATRKGCQRGDKMNAAAQASWAMSELGVQGDALGVWGWEG